MANSFQSHTANGSTATFSWAQIDGYLSTTHLKVYVNSILKTITTEYTLDTTAKTITFTAGNTPSAGAYVEVRRVTPSTQAGLQVTFSDASVLTAADLNNSQKQNLFIAQEAYDTGDGGISLNSSGNAWDAVTKRIERVEPPVNLTDAATKQYVDSLSLFGAYTVPQSWSYSGDGSKLNFDLSSPAPSCTDPAMFLVEVNGVLQRPTTNYGIALVGASYQLQFTGPAPSIGTNNIVVRNFGVARSALDVLPNSSVTAQYIASDAVETAKIQDGAVTTAKLATDAVTTAKILDGNVTAAKLATDAVTTVKVLDANITNAKLATDAVTEVKIQNGAVATDKIANGAVNNAKIASGAVSYAQLKETGFTGAGGGAYRMIHADASGNLAITNLGTALATQPLSSLGAPTADVSLNSFKLTSVADPTSAQHAVTKAYLESGTRVGQVAVILAENTTIHAQYAGTSTTVFNNVGTPTGNITGLRAPAGHTWSGTASNSTGFARITITSSACTLVAAGGGLSLTPTAVSIVVVRTS